MKVCFKKIKDKLINAIFPNNIKCLICSKELSENTLYSLCEQCLNELPFNTGKTCLRCDEPLTSASNYCLKCKSIVPYFKHNKSVFLYEGKIKSFVRGLKYDNKRYYATTLSNFLAGEYVKLNKDFDVVIPVPLHTNRLKERGFNQSELLCKSLKDKLKLNVDTKILGKVVYTESQTHLTRQDREKNLHDSFKVIDKSKIKGKRVLLVDDVFTTGSTINECARTLKDAGAKEVCSLTLAHAYLEIKLNEKNNKEAKQNLNKKQN